MPLNTDAQNGAVILGIDGQLPGGKPRGASAIDFQNDRANDTQVANGKRSFIAVGSNNTAGADHSHAEGIYSTIDADADAAHADGYADADTAKIALGDGSHAAGYAAVGAEINAIADGSYARGYATGSGEITDSSPRRCSVSTWRTCRRRNLADNPSNGNSQVSYTVETPPTTP